jgi:hypothetical protein
MGLQVRPVLLAFKATTPTPKPAAPAQSSVQIASPVTTIPLVRTAQRATVQLTVAYVWPATIITPAFASSAH